MAYTLTEKEIAHFASQLPADTKVITIEGLDKPGGYDVWDFVEQFHPDYEGLEQITQHHYLTMIIQGEVLINPNAILLKKSIFHGLNSKYAFDMTYWKPTTEEEIIEEAKNMIAPLNASIFQDAIENFIKLMKGK